MVGIRAMAEFCKVKISTSRCDVSVLIRVREVLYTVPHFSPWCSSSTFAISFSDEAVSAYLMVSDHLSDG
jgi:hypothetical protein